MSEPEETKGHKDDGVDNSVKEGNTAKKNLDTKIIDHAAKSSPVHSVISMQTDHSKEDPPVFTGELTHSSRMSTAGLGGVLCSVCPKIAFKSCLTCVASYCETHVRQHYTAPALQRHKLVEATEDLEERYRELENLQTMESGLTAQKNIPAPKPIQFKSVKTDSVYLAWEAPEGMTTTPRYRVTWRSEGDSDSLILSSQEVDVQNLTPGERYTFTVAIIDGDGSQGPCVSATVLTEIPAPELVKVTAGPVVSVSWNKPAGVDEVSYLVTLSSGGKCLKTISTKSLHYSFSDLPMGTEYTTCVSAVQKNGAQSKPVFKTIRTGRGTLASTTRPFVKESVPIEELTRHCRTIKSGIPRCYLLPTVESKIYQHSVRRWSFGKCNMSKPTKNILLVGEIGTGKTTVINTMVNYLLGVKLEDRVWFEIAEEDKKWSQTKSQSCAITVYELFLETSPLNLRVIDTPGYRGLDGFKHNEELADNLHLLFQSEDGIHEIDAVCLVMKSTQNCLAEFQNYIFDAIYSLFGNDIKRHIVLFATHSHGLSASNVIAVLTEAEVPCARDASGTILYFEFNNRQSESHEEGHRDLYQGFWNLGKESLDNFLRILGDMQRIEVKMIERIPTKRFRLVTCINNLQTAIKLKELKQSELQQFLRSLEEATFEVDEPYKDRVSIKAPWWHFHKGATCCSICEENCHYPNCWLAKNPSECEHIGKRRCAVCTNRCFVRFHAKDMFIYVLNTRRIKKTAEDLKQQYEKPEDIEKELRQIKAKTLKGLEEAYQCIMELNKKFWKKYAFSNIDLDFFIEKMEEMGEYEKAQMLRSVTSEKRRRSLPEEIQLLLDDEDEVITHYSRPQQGSVSGEAQVRYRSSALRHPFE